MKLKWRYMNEWGREVQSDEFKSNYYKLEASIVCNLSATIRLCDI